MILALIIAVVFAAFAIWVFLCAVSDCRDAELG